MSYFAMPTIAENYGYDPEMHRRGELPHGMGISTRGLFAAFAMSGLCAGKSTCSPGMRKERIIEAAKLAYEIADIMTEMESHK